MGEGLHIDLLGRFRITCDGKVENSVNTIRVQELLAWLIIHRDTPQQRQRLSFIFWPDSAENQARANLRNLFFQLRETVPFADRLIDSDFKTIRWNPEISVRVDLVEFEEVVASARKAEQAGDPERRMSMLIRAADIYADPLLPDSYEEWVERPRNRLRSMYREVLKNLVELMEERQEYDSAIAYARKWTQSEPLNESAWRTLMRLHGFNNNRSGALRAYRKCEEILGRELEIEPGEKTKELFGRLTKGSRAAGTREAGRPESGSGVTLSKPVETDDWLVRGFQMFSIYTTAALLVFGASYGLTHWLGLPEWTVSATVVLLIFAVPFAVSTGLVEMTIRSSSGEVSEHPVQAAARRLEAVAGSWLRWNNLLRWNALAFGVLTLAVAGYMASRTLGVGPFATLMAAGELEEEDRIVLADFATQSADSTLAHTVTEAFRVDLLQSGTVKLVDEASVEAVLRRMKRNPKVPLDFETAREVAIRNGYSAVVAGEINSVGSSFVLSLRLVGAGNGEELFADRETAKNEDAIIEAIENLSRRMRKSIGESLASVRASPPLSRYRTESLEALKRFTVSTDALLRGDSERCVSLLNEALAIDSLFAAAYWGRGICYWNMGLHMDRAVADISRAFELRDRMSDYGRAGLMDHYYVLVKGDLERGKEVLESYLELNPEDSLRNRFLMANLAGRYEGLGLYANAEELTRQVIKLDVRSDNIRFSTSLLTFGNLVRLLIKQGKFDEAEQSLREMEEINPDNYMTLESRANVAFASGNYTEAERIVNRWREQERGSPYHRTQTGRRLAMLAAIRGRIDEAESYLQDVMISREKQGDIFGYHQYAHSLAAVQRWLTGDEARAQRTLAAALDRHQLHDIRLRKRGYHQLAIIHAIVGEPEKARDFIAEARDSIPNAMQGRYADLIRMARSWIAVAEGRLKDAAAEINDLNRGRNRAAEPDRVFATGLIYDRMGRTDSAIAQYERFLDRPYVGWEYKVWWRPIVLERLGRLYEELGNAEKAIQYYSRFAELWKECDPTLKPRVDAAKQAVTRLSIVTEG
ncbi:MAG: BTAD domain-containing putative transcriptional regulator [Balneolaceae bacterium]|nr:BTAD domain-containing putative transcriptional regulator [Balneolaceae bacterium]